MLEYHITPTSVRKQNGGRRVPAYVPHRGIDVLATLLYGALCRGRAACVNRALGGPPSPSVLVYVPAAVLGGPRALEMGPVQTDPPYSVWTHRPRHGTVHRPG